MRRGQEQYHKKISRIIFANKCLISCLYYNIRKKLMSEKKWRKATQTFIECVTDNKAYAKTVTTYYVKRIIYLI